MGAPARRPVGDRSPRPARAAFHSAPCGRVLRESLRPPHYVGAAIAVGAGLSSAGGERAFGWCEHKGAVRSMLASSLMTATALTLVKDVLARNRYTPTLAWLIVGMGASGLASVIWRRRSTALAVVGELAPADWAASAVSEGVSLGADALLLYAISLGPVGLVALTAGLEPVCVLALTLAKTRRRAGSLAGHTSPTDLAIQSVGRRRPRSGPRTRCRSAGALAAGK